MIYGYARISMKTQNIERQIKNLTGYQKDIIIHQEAFTGTTKERPEWKKLLKKLRSGDTVVFDSVSRMSRNSEEGIQLYNTLMSEGVELVFIKEPYINTELIRDSIKKASGINLGSDDKMIQRTEEYIKDILLIQIDKQIEIAFNQAEKEVKDLQRRTSEGIREARAKGKKFGGEVTKGKKLVTKKSLEKKEQIIKLDRAFRGNLKSSEVMELIGISRNTYFKYKKEVLEGGTYEK